jgi:hypothetical protein
MEAVRISETLVNFYQTTRLESTIVQEAKTKEENNDEMDSWK